MSQRGDFDPRFDPVFQPGFDPEVHRSRLHLTRQQAADATRPDSAGVDATRPDSAGVDATHPASAAEAHPAEVPLGRNRFARALWIVTGGLLAGGLLLLWWATTFDYRSFNMADQLPLANYLVQIAWTLAPNMVLVGMAGIVAMLFWYGARWRP